MSRVRITAVALGAFILLGCGKDAAVKEIRQLREAGDVRGGRDRAVEILRDDPSRKQVWIEFVRCSAELSREEELRGGDPFPLVIQAALAAAAVHRHEKKPSEEWKRAGMAVSTEVIRQANQLTTTMRSEVRAARYVQQLTERPPSGSEGTMRSLQSLDRLDEFRRDGRELLYRETVIELLLAALPESVEGTNSELTNQMSLAKTEWIQALSLGPEYTQPIIDRAQQQVRAALDKAAGDLHELGYFLFDTIADNGIL